MLQRLLLGSGGEHCDLELAVEARRGAEADIKSNDSHLTGAEIRVTSPIYS